MPVWLVRYNVITEYDYDIVAIDEKSAREEAERLFKLDQGDKEGDYHNVHVMRLDRERA